MTNCRMPPLALVLALLLGVTTPAWAHATYVLDAWLEPERPEPGRPVTLTVEMLDNRGAPVSDHQLAAEASGGSEDEDRVALSEARAGVYRADLPARRGDWTIRIVDLTHVREERLTTLDVATGRGASQGSQGASAASDADGGEAPAPGVAWRWIGVVAAAALIAGIGATLGAVRRTNSDAP